MEEQNKRIEIELRSDEFQEIVQQSPRWMIRSGISLIFGLFVVMLAGSYFFRYPDVIKCNVVLGYENPSSNNDTLMNSPEQKAFGLQTPIIGRINLPVKYFGKVAVGQKVNIKLEDFPSNEYGFIKARIKNISTTPKNGIYLVEVQLPQDLMTNFNIPIKFSQEMKGSAEIITEDLRLIQRFINPVKSLLKHRISTTN
ncbi:MAG TPA: hypothetical protein DCR40_00285 [Prolixibacteraceae bacterium]|nr:hypothetical protein [Prolixibacteraceae bacterium]